MNKRLTLLLVTTLGFKRLVAAIALGISVTSTANAQIIISISSDTDDLSDCSPPYYIAKWELSHPVPLNYWLVSQVSLFQHSTGLTFTQAHRNHRPGSNIIGIDGSIPQYIPVGPGSGYIYGYVQFWLWNGTYTYRGFSFLPVSVFQGGYYWCLF